VVRLGGSVGGTSILPMPFRRDMAPKDQIPVGVRGTTRGDRWGCFVARNQVCRVVRPEDLLMRSWSIAHAHCRRFDRWMKDGAISPLCGGRPGALDLNSPADSSAQTNRAIWTSSSARRRGFPGHAEFADKILSAMRYEFGGHEER